MKFEILGKIQDIEVIAQGSGIRSLGYLEKTHGAGHWRKLEGTTRVRPPNGSVKLVELHWHEAHGIGRREIKIKRILE